MMIATLARAAAGSLVFLVLSSTQSPTAFAINGCGLLGETCCQTNPQCETGAICIGDTCVSCGGLDEFCCPNGVCESDLTCLAQFAENVEGRGGGAAVAPLLCVPCGEAGEPCCGSETCDSGFVCEPCLFETVPGEGAGAGNGVIPCPLGSPDVCLPCGGLAQRCCEGETCNEGFDCRVLGLETAGEGSGAGRVSTTCVPCGALDQPCCDQQTCLGDNLICGAELCEECGDIGEQCCPNDTCPGSGGLCTAGVCAAIPAVAAMSGGALIALILTLTAVAAFWMRRTKSL
jgi:hypothetical protein